MAFAHGKNNKSNQTDQTNKTNQTKQTNRFNQTGFFPFNTFRKGPTAKKFILFFWLVMPGSGTALVGWQRDLNQEGIHPHPGPPLVIPEATGEYKEHVFEGWIQKDEDLFDIVEMRISVNTDYDILVWILDIDLKFF